ncbi:hypothetical protein J2I47_07765 [Fibrella sp. HMF5335]|uniref:Uncharacterized protein n=1 Tax=Fibrella rubiginis TaxID=2817060 RepID=A0A939GGP4_9BACT|nr:hypothetical protein [Fibrella rubiginis]MBO0936441.1 hypothetical protein [Fibrella rubiginis]
MRPTNLLRPTLRRAWWPSARWLLRQVRRWEQQPLIRRRTGLMLVFVGLLGTLVLSVRYARLYLFNESVNNVPYKQPSNYGNPHATQSSQARRP